MTLPILVFTLLSFQAPVIDNQRVQVQELHGAADSVPYDAVWVSRKGHVAFLNKGSLHKADGTGILISLKDFKAEPLVNKSGYPAAFPRPGSKKLFENARVVVWNYSWTPGVATPMHFHDKDVVVYYLADGDLQSTTPSGEKTVNEYRPGMIRFNLRDRTHTETLIRGKQHGIMTELK
jgi:hypothetical protein